MRRMAFVLAAIVLASGCAGTRVPRLAKCAGPYRFANTNGTILPSLPIPGQQSAASTPPAAPEPLRPGATPKPQPKPDGKPAKTSALQLYFPSC